METKYVLATSYTNLLKEPISNDWTGFVTDDIIVELGSGTKSAAKVAEGLEGTDLIVKHVFALKKGNLQIQKYFYITKK